MGGKDKHAFLIPFARWEGEGVNEKGVEVATGKVRVQIDPKFYRPTEVVRYMVFHVLMCHS